MPSTSFALVPSIVVDATAIASAASVVRDKLHERRASVELSFDADGSDFGFLVFSGMEVLADRLDRFFMTETDRALLKMQPWLDAATRETLQALRCSLDVDAPAEGTVVFAHEPVVTIEGPLAQVLLVAPLFERIIGLATSVATRAARLKLAAAGDQLVDASSALTGDPDLIIARAAFIGGCAATTQPAASSVLGIPLHATAPRAVVGIGEDAAHPSDPWGESPSDEPKALSGSADEAIDLAERRRSGERGIWLARGLAFPAIAAITRFDLVALEQGGSWAPRLGFARDSRVLPGRKQVVRYSDPSGAPMADLIQLASERVKSAADATLIAEPGPSFAQSIEKGLVPSPLRVAVLRSGRRSGAPDLPSGARAQGEKSVSALEPAVRRLHGATRYRVGISRGVLDLRASMLVP